MNPHADGRLGGVHSRERRTYRVKGRGSSSTSGATMPSHPRDAKREAIIQAEIERSVARWRGMVPPHMLAKMREMAEEYYRTDPIAVRVINLLAEESTREESG